MPGEQINIGSIYADLDVNSGKMERGIVRAQDAIRKMENEIRALDVLLKQKGIGAPEHAALVNQYVGHIDVLLNKMNQAHAAIAGPANAVDLLNKKLEESSKGMQGGSHAANRFAMGLMQLGYIVDDLQYGFSSIVNNIAPLIHGLGGSAGLAVGAQVTAVAAYQLYNNWDKLNEVFGNTAAPDTARMSIDQLGESIKKLQKDVENFSWGDIFKEEALGIDPDKGKRQELELQKEELKKRQKALKVADEAEEFKTPQVKKEEERYLQALGESQEKVKKEGFKDVADKLAAKMLEQVEKGGGDLSQFLPQEKKTGQSESPAELYRRLTEIPKIGLKLNDDQLSRLRSLEAQARAELRGKAQEYLGGASGDIRKAGEVGDLIGGREGDVIAGRRQTEKDRLESEKEEIEYAKKDRELRKKQVKDFIERAVPDLKAQSDRLAARQDRGEMSERARREVLGNILMGGNLKSVISDKEREEAVQAEIDRTAEEDPHKRADRLRREASARAREAVPDFQRRADRAADEVHRGLTSGDEAREQMLDLLTGKGLSKGEAETALDAEESRLAKESPERRSHRLKREAMSKAEEIVPDLADTVESQVAKGLLTGRGVGKFKDELDRVLAENGMLDQGEREDAVAGLLDKGQESVRQRLANLATGQQGGREDARSEVFASSQLTAKVQAGVGTDSEPKKQTGLLEKMSTALEKIANKSTVQVEVS